MKPLTCLMKRTFKISLSCLALPFVLSACSLTSVLNAPTASAPTTGVPTVGVPYINGIASLNGYQISLFASGTASYFQPNSAVTDGSHIFIDYQNAAANDGSDTKSSTIVEYTMDGKVVKTFSVPGRSNGMSIDPTSHLLWVVSNKIANPHLTTIDPASGTVTHYTFPKPPHSGGYADIAFIDESAFVSASNPLTNNIGVNISPAVDKIRLSKGQIVLTPVLMGNNSAIDITAGSNNAQGSLNILDPEALSTDAKGNLVLLNQSNEEAIFISKPGTAQQKVTRLTIGSELNQVVWATSAHGRLLLVDGSRDAIYWIQTIFTPGTAYTQTGNTSGIAGVLGTLDLSTGIVLPVAIGFSNPSGLLFVPDARS